MSKNSDEKSCFEHSKKTFLNFNKKSKKKLDFLSNKFIFA
jgi:hypothetical protein